MTAQPPANAVHPQTHAEWRNWLQKNHQRDEEVWFIHYKKSSGKPFVDVNEAIEEAICFGWIDSLPRILDEERTMLYFAPRKSRSNWSGLNKTRAENLLAAGLMTPSGLEKIEAAKKDGS